MKNGAGLVSFSLVVIAVFSVQLSAAELDTDKLKIGPVELHPHLGGTFTYDDNIFISNGNKRGDYYGTITPGLQLLYGNEARNQISLDYQANIQRFMQNTDQDTVDHMANLKGHLDLNRLSIDASQSYVRATGGETRDINGVPTEQVGERIPNSRTTVTQYATNLRGEYDFSPKTAVGLHYDQSFTSYETKGLIGSDQYRVGVPVYYHVSSKTDVYGEFNGGVVNVDEGANATFEEFNIGMRTKITGKMNGFASVGYQHRDFDGDEGTMNSVVANSGVNVVLTKHLTATLTVSRNINPAATAVNTSYTATMADASVSWRTWHDKITMTVGGGYERDEYNRDFGTTDRKDDYWNARWSCDYMIKKWWQTGIMYRYRTNESELAMANFDSNMVSLYTRLTF